MVVEVVVSAGKVDVELSSKEVSFRMLEQDHVDACIL